MHIHAISDPGSNEFYEFWYSKSASCVPNDIKKKNRNPTPCSSISNHPSVTDKGLGAVFDKLLLQCAKIAIA